MSIWGTILGGAAGFALGGPLGALVGAAAGHAVDRLAQTEADGAVPPDNTRHIAFTIGVIALGAKMAKVDGTVTDDEIAAFHRVFRVPPEETQNVARVFNLARRDARGFEPYARQLAAMFKDRPAVLEELLQCLFHIARADGRVGREEAGYLRAVADIFGLDAAEFERVRLAGGQPEESDPYRVLGIDRSRGVEAIKAAYRKLIRENHPDRLIAAGMPQEFVDIANAKVAAITGAYARIRAERGFA